MADLLNLSKEESLNLLDLRKNEINKLCLEKPALQNTQSRVALVLDYSGSMSNLYSNGTVQTIIEKALPLAMQFDDNGEMEVWIFENGFYRLPSITLDNFYGYIKEKINGKYRMGGTCYAPVMKDIAKKYIEEDPVNLPNYVMFITDGDNSDKDATTTAIKALSKYPIFFQFLGIGNSRFNYLETLDEMDGRFVDNANFFTVNNIVKMNDGELYKKLLAEYPTWLELPQVKEMIAKANVSQKVDYNKVEKKGFFGKLFG